MKAVSAGMKGEHSQFRELQAFAQFGTSDLDAATRRQLERGQRVNEVIKQGLLAPLSLHEEVAVIFALMRGHLDDVPVNKIADFEVGLRKYMASNHPDLIDDINNIRELTPEIEQKLTNMITTFKETVPY